MRHLLWFAISCAGFSQSFAADLSCSNKNGLLITTTANVQTPFQTVHISNSELSSLGDFFGYSSPLYQKDSVTQQLDLVINANHISNHVVSTLNLTIELDGLSPTSGPAKLVIFDGTKTMRVDALSCH